VSCVYCGRAGAWAARPGQASFIRLGGRACTGSNGSAWGPGRGVAGRGGRTMGAVAQKRRAATAGAWGLGPGRAPCVRCRRTAAPFVLRGPARPRGRRPTSLRWRRAVHSHGPACCAPLWTLWAARSGRHGRRARSQRLCHAAPASPPTTATRCVLCVLCRPLSPARPHARAPWHASPVSPVIVPPKQPFRGPLDPSEPAVRIRAPSHVRWHAATP
jgi:hypothetical protein